MFGNDAEWDAYQLGQIYGDMGTSGGPSYAGWYSPAQVAGVVAVCDALVRALAEVAPDHPLTKKENRNRINVAAFNASAGKK